MTSIAQLNALSGAQITDLHREHIDDVTFRFLRTMRFIDVYLKCWTAGLNLGLCAPLLPV